MKHLPLALLLLVSFATCSLADSPEAILKDYRKQASQAVERLNQSLEKAAMPLITKLVQQGDTAGSEELTKQMKAKIAGEPVAAPQASAVQLFALYDEARAKALAPVQKSSIARIESILKTAGGAKIETITELGKVREEITSGRITTLEVLPTRWTYHQKLDLKSTADVVLLPNHVMEFHEQMGTVKKGTWKTAKSGIVISFMNEEWRLNISGDVATFERPKVGTRYLKVNGSAN